LTISGVGGRHPRDLRDHRARPDLRDSVDGRASPDDEGWFARTGHCLTIVADEGGITPYRRSYTTDCWAARNRHRLRIRSPFPNLCYHEFGFPYLAAPAADVSCPGFAPCGGGNTLGCFRIRCPRCNRCIAGDD
jgi:hypothetical protein